MPAVPPATTDTKQRQSNPAGDALAARRIIGTRLDFWRGCGHKACFRARRCVTDPLGCFKMFWPDVSDEFKAALREWIAQMKAREGL